MNDKSEFMQEQMQEVEAIKAYLSKSKVSVDADVLAKAIVLPQEVEYAIAGRQYPKLKEMLFQNPFPKKEKKGKKKKKKA
mmetsp:Transcript_43219/g.31558  ORF Transcript_43219/g.31558 Transcript_43219/m.31558 type:complete len:80 (-) Transcript_43219:10-249(-)